MSSLCFSPASAAARPSETGPQSRVQVPAPVNASTLVASLSSFLRRVPSLLAAAVTSAVCPILVSPLPLDGSLSLDRSSSPSVGSVVTAPVGPVCTPPRLSPRAFTLSMSHYFESVPRVSPSSSVRSASSGSPGRSVSVSNLEDPFVDASSPAVDSLIHPLVSPVPRPNFEQLMALADWQIEKARAYTATYTAKRQAASVAANTPRTPEPRTPELRILKPENLEPPTLSPMTCSPSADASPEEHGSLFRNPVEPPCTPPPCTPPPREMDTLDRSVERQRIRARELSAEAKVKFAQLRSLLADWPAPKRRYAPSYDYSTESPTPHTISNWDSTLEEDRISEYSWTKGAFPVASPQPLGALAEWDSPAVSPGYSRSPVASSSGSVGSSGSPGSSGSSGTHGSTGSSGSGGSSGYCASPGSTGSFGTSSFFGSPGCPGPPEESGSISSLLELYGPRSPAPVPVPVPVPAPELEFDLVTTKIKGAKGITLRITRRVPRVRS
ncbi:hypothetical protein SGCOL_005579 [Colletotrichum sp. CLE4]